MLTYETTHTPHRDRIATAAVHGPRIPFRLRHPSLSAHEQAALANAVDDGLMPDEVAQILAGRRVAEAFPVRRGESPAAYASRAVSEMFVAYLQ
ncbi:hypothetical protein [Methylobacterium mesophilicum]|uniref:hypothetical protein n=1 Tax=Methylobacterium mesophilicum TaxID=39956 RepID=UPI0002C60544|nr:hypothetical protein [Methylobacterium mesophilicum]